MSAFLFLFTGFLASANVHMTFSEATSALQRGEHEQAIEQYEELLALGIEDGDLHYNLGNAYLRAGKVGRAIAAYRRSERHLPRDEDVEKNLAYARERSKDALAPPTPSAVLSTLFFWHYALGPRELMTLVALAQITLFAALSLRRLGILRRATGIVALAAGLAVFALLPSWLLRELSPGRLAVVTVAEAAVRAANLEDAVTRFVLHDGAEASLVEESAGWLRLELSDGKQGWVRVTDVEVVVL